MAEYLGEDDARAWLLPTTVSNSARRSHMRMIAKGFGTRAATAYAHVTFGIVDGNCSDRRRHPLKWLWFDLKNRAGDRGEFSLLGRCVVVGRTNNPSCIAYFDIELGDGVLRLHYGGLDSGEYWYWWDREPTREEKVELSFFMLPHEMPAFRLYVPPYARS